MNGKDGKWLQKYKEILCHMDKQKWIVCILIGALLLVIAIPVEPKEKKTSQEEQTEAQEQVSGDAYEKQMEKRLERLLGQMDGVGSVDVMITLEDDGASVVAQDVNRTSSTAKQGEETRQETSAEESTVYSGEEPYQMKHTTPKVRGVCVVAQGAGNSETRVKIYEAVQALFSIEAHKISIVEMGVQEGT